MSKKVSSPDTSERNIRNTNLCVAFTKAEKAEIMKVAWSEDMSASRLIRKAIAEYLLSKRNIHED